jgi:hypothetical protein
MPAAAGASFAEAISRMASGNAILVIRPYRYSGTWVFDDPDVGLRSEPFVSGVPEMIDRLVRHIPDATGGFRLLFSASPFPGYQAAFERVRDDMGGTWYRNRDEPATEGWLCPALFKYFTEPPETIYAKAEPLRR